MTENKKKKERSFTLRLPPELYNRLVLRAQKQDRPVSSAVRKMIEQRLDELDREDEGKVGRDA